MKKLLILIVTFVASVAYAVPAMNVFTINTSDPMGYMEWARKSAPITSSFIKRYIRRSMSPKLWR